MSDNNNNNGGCGPTTLFWLIFMIATAIIGKNIHGSTFWAIVDFFFSPLAWLKWFICQEVSMKIIRESFTWFFN